MDTLTLFCKNLNQRSLTPRWPLTPCLLRSHVWLYLRIIVSQVPWQYINVCGYSDQFCKIPHTYTYYVQNEWSHSLLLNSVQARQKKKKKKTKKLTQNVENHFIVKTLKSLKNCTNLLFSIRFLSYTLLGCRCISPIWSSLDPNRRFLPHLRRAIRRFLLRWVDPRRSIQFWLP